MKRWVLSFRACIGVGVPLSCMLRERGVTESLLERARRKSGRLHSVD